MKRGIKDQYWGPLTSRAFREAMLKEIHRGPNQAEAQEESRRKKAEKRDAALKA